MRLSRSVLVKLLTAVAATAVVVVAMLWLSGTFRTDQIEPGSIAPEPVAADAAAPAAATQPVVVRRVTRPYLADVVGSVQAVNRAQVAARLLANILEVRVSAGDHVQAGDVVVMLDDRDQRARVAQASETLKAAEARRDLAKIELDRVSDMVARNVASEFELDRVRADYATAVADVARAGQSVAEAEVALSDTRIESPISGIVIDRLAEPGDQASPGKPLLTVYDPSRLRVEASARESYVGALSVGQELAVSIDALGGQERRGTVQEIVPQADPSSRSFDVKVLLADGQGLLPGMFARLRLPLDPREQLEVPLSAVRSVGQVQLVRVAGADGHVARRAVRLGERQGDTVEILAGLTEGETVLPW